MSDTPATKPKSSPDQLTVVLRWVLGAIGAVLVLLGLWYLYAWLITPEALRHPTHAHYHFRMQIINGGVPVNLGADKFQTEFNKDICTADLTKQPIHLHDNLDQFVHIHWDHITGGTVLKNYGWNFLGGTKYTLGYRFDQFPKLVRVPIHGLDLPTAPPDANYYVYTGNADGYEQRDFHDFINQDLTDFFSGKGAATSWVNWLVPAAYAHEGHDEAELIQINHVLGNVVIFAQADPPTPAQVKDRFSHLIDLPESSCGG